MKKILLLSAAAMAALFIPSLSHAQELAVQYATQDPLSPGEAAGVDGFQGWTTVTANGGAFYPFGNQNLTGPVTTSISGLTGMTTGPVSASVSYDGFYQHNYGGPTIPSDPGSSTLLLDGVGTSGAATTPPASNAGAYGPDAVTLTLSGLSAGEEYDLVAYIGGQQYNPTEASLSLTGLSTQYFMSARQGNFWPSMPNALLDGASTTNFVTGSGQNLNGLSGYQSNYVTFENLTGVSTATLTLTVLGAFGSNDSFVTAANGGNAIVGLNGFELFDEGPNLTPVPEPSTVWMFSLGFLGLMAHVYRKRYSRS